MLKLFNILPPKGLSDPINPTHLPLKRLNPCKIIVYFSNYKKNINFAVLKGLQRTFLHWHND